MIKDLLPPDMRCANDTVEMVIACCTEFIQLLSSESNEVATREGRSIIHPDHVMRALTELGFQDFVGEVNATLHTFKEETKTAHSRKADLRKTGAEQAGLTEEEQIALQQQMFAAARAQSMTTSEVAASMAASYDRMAAAAAAAAGAGAAAGAAPGAGGAPAGQPAAGIAPGVAAPPPGAPGAAGAGAPGLPEQ